MGQMFDGSPLFDLAKYEKKTFFLYFAESDETRRGAAIPKFPPDPVRIAPGSRPGPKAKKKLSKSRVPPKTILAENRW